MRRAAHGALFFTTIVAIGCGGTSLRTRPAVARAEPEPAISAPAVAETEERPEEEHSAADRALEEAVRVELESDPALPRGAIEVSALEGVIELRGEVPLLAMVDTAVERAEMISGARAVVSSIDVIPSGRDDESIRGDVATALRVHPSTARAREVQARTVGGVVTLIGTVPNRASARAAELVARNVRGVRDVVNRLELRPVEVRSDADLETAVRTSLRADRWVDSWSLEVEVNEGVVTLSGTQPNSAAKRRAIESAWVGGVRNVDARGLRVSALAAAAPAQPSTDRAGDQAVRGWLTDALAREPRVAHRVLDVQVRDGVAVLEGIVDSIEARRAAEEAALATVGVERVDNRLQIDRDHWQSSRRLRAYVQDALRVDARTADAPIEVEVRGGTVTLRGRVASAATRDAVRRTVERMGGVSEIRDELSAPEQVAAATGDAALQQDIVTRLSHSPYVDPTTLRVDVVAGEATLIGTVPDVRGRMAAVRAAHAAGARQVVDNLAVTEGIAAVAAH